MPTVRQETILSYKADARGLQSLSREMQRAFDPKEARELNRAYKNLQRELKLLTAEQIKLNDEIGKAEKGTAAYEALAKSLKDVETRMRQLRSVQGVGGGGPGGGPGGGQQQGAFTQGFAQGLAPGVATYLQRGPGMQQQMMGQALGAGIRGGGRAVGGALTGGGFAALFQDVPFLAGLSSLAQGAVGSAVQYQRAQLQAGMGLGVQARSAGEALGPGQGQLARGLGLSRMEALQAAAQAAAQIGGQGLSDIQGQALVQAQRGGVTGGTAAAFLRQTRAGRGGDIAGAASTREARGAVGLMTAIGEAVALGLRGSEIEESLAKLVQLQQEAEMQGITLRSDTITDMSRAFSAFGFAGVQADRLGGQAIRAGQRISRQGAGSAASVAFLRAAGFDPSNPNSYIDALMNLERGLTPEQMFSAARTIGGGIDDPRQRGFVLQRAFQGEGIQMSLEQAEQLGGSLGSMSAFRTAMRGIGRAGHESAVEVSGAGTPSNINLLRQQAAATDQLLKVGTEIGPSVLALNTNAAKLAEGVTNLAKPLLDDALPLATSLVDAIVDLTELIRKAQESSGISPWTMFVPGAAAVTPLMK